MNEYEKQAQQFLTKTNTKLTIKFLKYDTYFNDNLNRNIYRFTLKNENGQYSSTFGDSINSTKAGKTPSAYAILSCLGNGFYTEDYEDFLSEFGYEDNKVNKKIFKAIQKENLGLQRLFSNTQLESLFEIC